MIEAPPQAPAPPPMETPAAAQKKRVRRLIVTVVLISIGIHLAFGIVAGVIIVARYLIEPPAEFKAARDIRLPAKKREHKMNMAALDAMAPKPSFNDKMQSSRPAPFALPDLPKVPMDQMLPLDPSAIVSDQVSSMVGSGMGNGAGSGGAGGGGAGGMGFSFLGISSQKKRILLCFDISGSVVNKANASGMPLSKIKEETLNLLAKLPINARFGIVEFSQNYKVFKKELVPMTDQNREAIKSWINSEWTETGTLGGGSTVTNPKGFVGVLELAAQMQPDVIFVVTDGSFQWRVTGQISDIPWDDVKKIAKGPLQGPNGCAINFIGFQVKPQNRGEMATIASSTHGKVREIK